jgi:acetoin utilization protein AcuB
MFIRTHMTRSPICVDPATHMRDVIRIMVQHKIDHIPVVDRRRHVIGIISEQELGRAAAVPDSHFLDERADDAMSRALHTIGHDEPLRCALDLLCEPGIDALLVQEHGLLVGILTRGDMLRILRRALALDCDGSSVEISLDGPGDLLAAFQVLHDQKAEIKSAVVGAVRDDGGGPVLGLRLGARDPRPVERALAQAALTLLVPAEERRCTDTAHLAAAGDRPYAPNRAPRAQGNTR